MPLRHVSSLAENTKREVMKMKRILVVLAALVLVFAVACDGDNPVPEGGSGGNSSIPGAPAINTGTSLQDLVRFASIAMTLNPISSDSEVASYMESLKDESTVSFTNKAQTLTLSGSRTDTSMTLTIAMEKYSIDASLGELQENVTCTVWGTFTLSGSIPSNMEEADLVYVYDYVVKIDSTGEVFSFNFDTGSNKFVVNGQDMSQYMTPADSE